MEDKLTKMESIGAYQAIVAKGAAEYAKEKKILLQTKLEKLREEMGSARENGVDPLLIFPEEVWALILDKVTDWRDLTCLAKANHLLDRILAPTKRQWLFGKVLPLVSKYLDKSDVYKCRYVCKHWCAGVDNNFETSQLVEYPSWSDTCISNDLRIGSPERCSNKWGNFLETFRFGIPARRSYLDLDDEIKGEIDNHPRNPFVGRAVTFVVLDSCPIAFIHALSEFLDVHGPNIWHLKFTTSADTPFRSCDAHYEACVMILKRCRNLRSLTLGGVFAMKPPETKDLPESLPESAELEEPLPLHPHLESLEVIMDFPSTLISQDRLISKYSGQLKRLIVKTWSSSYNNLDWNNLRDLQIPTGISDDLSDNLLNMSAPNLRNFGIFIDERSRSPNSLELLMRIIRHFQNLDTFKLKFLSGFRGFSVDEIVSLPQEFSFAPHIQTVSLDIATSDKVSYNFLLAFPFLKKIQILESRRGVTLWNVGDRPYSASSAVDDADILEISGYMECWGMSFYDTTVWKLLPSLQTIVVGQYRRHHRDKDVDRVTSRCTYRRECSQRSKMDKNGFRTLLLTIAQKEKTRQQNLKGDLLRENLEEWRIVVRAGTRAVETENTKISKEVFSNLIKYLDLQDVLNCRKVCREWQSSVDAALEGYSAETTPEGYPHLAIVPRSYQPASFFDFEYSFTHNSCRKAISLHPRNPFIGRTACFLLTKDQQDPADVGQFVEQLGKHIWHFSLSIGTITVNGISGNRSQYYLMVVSILRNCENLRTLRLSQTNLIRTNREEVEEEMSAWKYLCSRNPLPKNPNLEALFLENRDLRFCKIQNALLTAYSGQLKCFRTYQWLSSRSDENEEVHLSWDNLEELHAEERTELARCLLNSFTRITAPNLKILDIGYIAYGLDWKLLMIIINRFPKLNYLTLRLDEGYLDRGFSSDEWKAMTPGLISHAALTKLKIVTGRKYKMSFEFLLFFPLLKELCIRETHDETRNLEESVGYFGNFLGGEDDHESEEENEDDDDGDQDEGSGAEDAVLGLGEEDGDGDFDETNDDDAEEENLAGEDCLKNESRDSGEGLVPMETDNSVEEEDSEFEENEIDDMMDETDEEQPPPKRDFVYFPENYWEKQYEEAEVYAMNFWQVLESLQSLKFSQNLPLDDQERRVHIFTREKYDRFRKKQ